MKRNNVIVLVGLVLTFVSTGLKAGFLSRAREAFFGSQNTHVEQHRPQNTQIEQHRQQLERDVQEQGASALRRPKQAPHGSQEYYTPSPAPTSYATQPPLTPSQQAAQRGQAPLPPSTPAHTPQAPIYTTQQHYQGQGTPSQYAAPQAGHPQPKQSFFGRVAHKVTNIVNPKKEVVIGGPTGFRSNRDTILNQTEFRELKEADEAAARARAIPPKPTYSPPPRPQQPAAFSNDIPSEPRLSQRFPQTPPPSAPLVQPVRPSRTTPEGGDISGPTNARPYVPKTAEEIERARVAKAAQEAFEVASKERNVQPITYEPGQHQPQQPTPPSKPVRYINVPATRIDGQSADAPSLPLH